MLRPPKAPSANCFRSEFRYTFAEWPNCWSSNSAQVNYTATSALDIGNTRGAEYGMYEDLADLRPPSPGLPDETLSKIRVIYEAMSPVMA